jgi:uncharacterized protein HemX
MRPEGAKRVVPNDNSPYEVSAWALTRERTSQSLREYYQVTTELPPALLRLVGKLEALEGNLQVATELPRSLLTLVKKLDAVEGNLLLRRIQEAPAGRRKKPTVN